MSQRRVKKLVPVQALTTFEQEKKQRDGKTQWTYRHRRGVMFLCSERQAERWEAEGLVKRLDADEN